MNIVDLSVGLDEVPRDGKDRPLVIPKTGGKPVALTRTTTFIDCIEDKSNLSDWGKRSVLIGAQRQPSLLEAVDGLDPKADKWKLDALAERAMDAAGANDKREKGSHLHELSEYVDRGEQLPERTRFGVTVEQDIIDMAAYKMATVGLDVLSVEQFVVCLELGTGGTYDRLVHYAGPGPLKDEEGSPIWIEGTFIGDLKTGSTEYGGSKMAAQLAVYSHGETYDWTKFPVNARDKDAIKRWKKVVVEAEQAAAAYSPLPEEINQEWGIIIALPSGSGECSLHWADLKLGWELAQLALTIRSARTRGRKALLPFAV